MRKFSLALAGAVLLLAVGCSNSPQTVAKKEPEKPPEPVTGQSALFKMYQVAKSWQRDAEVLKISSMAVPEMPNVPRGMAAAWEGQFTSLNSNRVKTYTYSVIEVLPNLRQGVYAVTEGSWSGPRGVTSPFRIEAIKTDTDKAYQVALENAGDYEKKNPGKAITLLLEKNNRYSEPAWRVIWGESLGTSNFSVFVNATTGKYLEKMH